jgi:hypothetical protein
MLLLLLPTLPLPAMTAPMLLKCTQRGDTVTVSQNAPELHQMARNTFTTRH